MPAIQCRTEAAYRLVRCKKPHTVAEELILPFATDMVSTIIDETAASKLKAMPLSKTTKSPLMLPLQRLVHYFFFEEDLTLLTLLS